jgi:hypothetical protein
MDPKNLSSECGPSYGLFRPFLIRWFEAESRDQVLGGLRTWGLHTLEVVQSRCWFNTHDVGIQVKLFVDPDER